MSNIYCKLRWTRSTPWYACALHSRSRSLPILLQRYVGVISCDLFGPARLTLHQYAQRAIMKITRFMKLKAFASDSAELLLEQSQNPLKQTVTVDEPTCDYTTKWLAGFRQPLDTERAQTEP